MSARGLQKDKMLLLTFSYLCPSPLDLSVNCVMKVKLYVIERKPGEQEQVQTWMTSDIWTDYDY